MVVGDKWAFSNPDLHLGAGLVETCSPQEGEALRHDVWAALPVEDFAGVYLNAGALTRLREHHWLFSKSGKPELVQNMVLSVRTCSTLMVILGDTPFLDKHGGILEVFQGSTNGCTVIFLCSSQPMINQPMVFQ